MPRPEESKYVQQHLANERTFLAWIRTIIAILGIGFVTTSLHFELAREMHPFSDALVRGIGLFTIFIALVAAIYACWSYLHKRRGINSGQFQSAFRFPILLSACLVLMLLAMVAYLLTAY